MQSFDDDVYGEPRGSWAIFLAGACVGAAAMSLADPIGGARRRAVVRDKVTRAARKTIDGLDATGRDVSNRAAGVWWSTRRRLTSEDVPDHVLVQRVRSALGRFVSHPRAITVDANSGSVTLKGQILTSEVRPLMRAVARVPGVHEIHDFLEQHERADNVPSLQGGSTPAGSSFDLSQEHWAPATRTLVGAAGAGLVAFCAARRDVYGALFGLAGLALVLRAASNVDAAQLFRTGGDWEWESALRGTEPRAEVRNTPRDAGPMAQQPDTPM
jgi:BON domain